LARRLLANPPRLKACYDRNSVDSIVQRRALLELRCIVVFDAICSIKRDFT